MTSLTAVELGFVGFLWVLWLGECIERLISCPLLVLTRFLQHAAPMPLQPLLALPLTAVSTVVSS